MFSLRKVMRLGLVPAVLFFSSAKNIKSDESNETQDQKPNTASTIQEVNNAKTNKSGNPLQFINREIGYYNNKVVITYRFKNETSNPINLGDYAATYSGSVSNTRSFDRRHGYPREINATFNLLNLTSTSCTVIPDNKKEQCNQIISTDFTGKANGKNEIPAGKEYDLTFTFTHNHPSHEFDPLSDNGKIKIYKTNKINKPDAKIIFYDEFITPVFYIPNIIPALNKIPELWNDWVSEDGIKEPESVPDTLVLRAHVTNMGYYDFAPVDIPFGTPLELSFDCYIAPGTQGKCMARVQQFRHVDWERNSNGKFDDENIGDAFDLELGVKKSEIPKPVIKTQGTLKDPEVVTKERNEGKKFRVVQRFTTSPKTNKIKLDFRLIENGGIGVMRIDNVKFTRTDLTKEDLNL